MKLLALHTDYIRFKPLKKEHVKSIIDNIAKAENIIIEKDAIDIVEKANESYSG